MGYSLNPVAPLTESHNPVYAPLLFALREYLEVFVLKKNRVSYGDKLEEGLPLPRFRYPAYDTCFRPSGVCLPGVLSSLEAVFDVQDS